MKVLHVVEASGGGVGRHVLDLSEGLLSRGHEVHLAYSPRRADRFFLDRLARLDGVRTRAIDLRRRPHPSDVGAVRVVREVLRDGGSFDLLHGHSSKGGAVARLAALSVGMPTVYTPNAVGTMDRTAWTATRYAVACAERILARVQGLVIAVSPAEEEHLARLGIPRHRLRMVPNCVREMELPGREEARRELGLARDAKVVGYVGRLALQKAPDVLVSAFCRVAQAHPDALLLIVGDGPLRPVLRRECEQLGVMDRVLWAGERNGQRTMPAFDVLVLPSRYEGLPHVLLEGLVAGLPIVATEAASAGLVVEPGENGLVVPEEDPEAVAHAIMRLLENEKERAAFGRASRLRASRFSHRRMVEGTLGVYREVVDAAVGAA